MSFKNSDESDMRPRPNRLLAINTETYDSILELYSIFAYSEV